MPPADVTVVALGRPSPRPSPALGRGGPIDFVAKIYHRNHGQTP